MIGGAFLGGGVELVPAGQCKLELQVMTEDRQNLAGTFTITDGTHTYSTTAGSDGRATINVVSGGTYTVSVSNTGYDNISPQTVIATQSTIKYVRFELPTSNVKVNGAQTINGQKTFTLTPVFSDGRVVLTDNAQSISGTKTFSKDIIIANSSSPSLELKNGTVARGTTPSSNLSVGGVVMMMSDGGIIGDIHTTVKSDNSTELSLSAIRNQASRVDNEIKIVTRPVDGNWESFVTIPYRNYNDLNVSDAMTIGMFKGQIATSFGATTSDSKVPSEKLVKTSLNGKQDTLTFDDSPTTNSDNPVKSKGILTALDGKVPTTRKVAGHALSSDITLSKSDVGLGNVNNTSDANKPISTATQNALNGKSNTGHTHSGLLAAAEDIPYGTAILNNSNESILLVVKNRSKQNTVVFLGWEDYSSSNLFVAAEHWDNNHGDGIATLTISVPPRRYYKIVSDRDRDWDTTSRRLHFRFT